MTLRAITIYEIACDFPGCTRTSGDLDGEYVGFLSDDQPKSHWEHWGGATNASGGDLCPEHAKCSGCSIDPGADL